MQDHDVRQFTADLGVPGIIDVHVHFMAPKVLRKVWAYFDAAGPMLGREWPITYRWSDEERVAHLQMMGVKCFSALSYAHRAGVAEFMNAWNRDFALSVPESLWSGTFYPEPSAAQYVPELIASGVQVFKAHLQVGEFAADDSMLDPVWTALEASGVPTVIHAGSGPAPGLHTGPRGVERVLERWPALPLIIAHLGMPEIHEFLDLAERFENVRLDTTMAFVDFFETPYPPGVPDRLLVLQDKILFGSDFPNIPYQYAHQVEVLHQLKLGDGWLRAVLWENAAALFNVRS